MTERTDQAPLAVQFQISRGPNDRGSDVAGEDGVFRRQLADQTRDILRENHIAVWPAFGQGIEMFAGFPVVTQAAI